MKIALLALLGLVLGTLGGAALGVGAGIAWVEIFNTSNFEGYSGLSRHRDRRRAWAGTAARPVKYVLFEHELSSESRYALFRIMFTGLCNYRYMHCICDNFAYLTR
jgi:hypothetical protein